MAETREQEQLSALKQAFGEKHYPLADFKGAPPPAPAWFSKILTHEPVRSTFDVEGAGIEMLAWGERGKPGLLFLHGDAAHADWWSFIAPFFAADYRCAAISWSGAGASDRRDAYSVAQLSREALAAVDAAGLNDGPCKPLAIAHSFGAYPTLVAGRGDTPFGGIILVDAVLVRFDAVKGMKPPGGKPHRLFNTLEDAIGGFRLLPPHYADTFYTMDLIARRSLKQVEGGWEWRFDPDMWSKMSKVEMSTYVAGVTCPIAYIRGEESVLVRDAQAAQLPGHLPAGTPIIALPDAGHHIMIDRPLSLVAAIRTLLATWAPKA